MKQLPVLKHLRAFKWFAAAVLLLLVAEAAISAVEGMDAGFGIRDVALGLQQYFDAWRGSKTLIVIAVIGLVLVVVGRGTERK